MQAGIIGGGVIGGGWLARLIENGIEVRVHDPDPQATRKLSEVLDLADRAYGRLSDLPRPARAPWRLCSSVGEAAEGADLVIEAVPERLEIKRGVYREIERVNREGTIASSTSGILPSDLQAAMETPGRLIVAHPFNPVYLLPLVELVAGRATDPARIDWAKEFYAGLGMHPLHCRVEIEGFLSDRLQEALWREALWLLHDRVATAEELDAAITYGPGLRWAQMGTLQTFHLAGGQGGMRAMLAMFGPCLKWPWTKLMDVPELTEGFVNRVGDECDRQAGDLSVGELARIRDDNLVAILHALKTNDWGAGRTLGAYERRLAQRRPSSTGLAPEGALRTLSGTVPPDWTDPSSRLSRVRQAQCFGEATETLLAMLGCEPHTSAGFVVVESSTRVSGDAAAFEPIVVDTTVVGAEGGTLRLHHRLCHGDGRLLAQCDEVLEHVDCDTRVPTPPPEVVATLMAKLAERHRSGPMAAGGG